MKFQRNPSNRVSFAAISQSHS